MLGSRVLACLLHDIATRQVSGSGSRRGKPVKARPDSATARSQQPFIGMNVLNWLPSKSYCNFFFLLLSHTYLRTVLNMAFVTTYTSLLLSYCYRSNFTAPTARASIEHVALQSRALRATSRVSVTFVGDVSHARARTAK